MLALPEVQLLSIVAIATVVIGRILEGNFQRPPPAKRKSAPPRGNGPLAQGVWVGSAAITISWPIWALLLPGYAYLWPPILDFLGSGEIQLAGYGLAILAGLLFYFSRRALGKFMTPVIQVREDHRLVDQGPYRFIRHPVYTALVLSSVGFALFFLSPILVSVAAIQAGTAQYRARVEERLLSSPEGFGDAYRSYMARTGRFIPRLWSSR